MLHQTRQTPPPPAYIRWAIRRDMGAMLAIEEETFEFPWLEEEFLRVLRAKNCIGMVAEIEGRVVGFVIYELHATRLHVLNLAVDHSVRRRGVGTALLAYLVRKLNATRRVRITADVRETNLPAQLFLQNVGFRAVNVLRSFYFDTDEDAYRFVRRMTEEEAAAAAAADEAAA